MGLNLLPHPLIGLGQHAVLRGEKYLTSQTHVPCNRFTKLFLLVDKYIIIFEKNILIVKLASKCSNNVSNAVFPGDHDCIYVALQVSLFQTELKLKLFSRPLRIQWTADIAESSSHVPAHD